MALKIVKYSTAWCGPCKLLTPVLKAFCEKESIELEERDVSLVPEEEKLAFSIKAVPTLVLHNTETPGVYKFLVGNKTVKELEEFIKI